MRIPNQFAVAPNPEKGGILAFTLVESMIAVLVAAIMFIALYASFASGFATVKLAREDLRATQIILQRLENLRLCSFTNIQNSVETDYFDPKDAINGTAGTIYTFNLTATTPLTTDMGGTLAAPIWYRTNMLVITARVTWTNAGILRTRVMQTYASRNGMQSYVLQPQQSL
jgi:type II secretory pathway pseudopilin PulG